METPSCNRMQRMTLDATLRTPIGPRKRAAAATSQSRRGRHRPVTSPADRDSRRRALRRSAEELRRPRCRYDPRGLHRRDEQTNVRRDDSRDKDPRRSLHVDEVRSRNSPRRGLHRVMASSITSTRVDEHLRAAAHLRILDRLGKNRSGDGATRSTITSSAPSRGRGASRFVGAQLEGRRRGHVHCNYVDVRPTSHDDSMLSSSRIWGFETNFGDWPTSRSSRRTN